MTSPVEDAPSEGEGGGGSSKQAYVPPTLERLGTIRELTLGLGMKNTFDGASPPGQNKSIL